MSHPVLFLVPFATPTPQGKEEIKNLKPEAAQTGQAPPPAGQPGTTAPGQPAAAPAQSCNPFGDSTFLMLGLMFVVMWLLVLRPESKRRKEEQKMRSSVQAGDTVVTSSGMHGVILSLTDTTVTLRVDTIKMVFERSAIARVVRDDQSRPKTDLAKTDKK